jgi:hypothetical protein
MAYVNYNNTFTSGDKIDAPLYNDNIDKILLGLSNGRNDLNVYSANAENVLVNKDLDSDDLYITDSLYCESASVGGVINSYEYFMLGGMALSGNSIVTVSTNDMNNNVINIDQSINKLYFENYTTTPASNFTSIRKISTVNFSDGVLVSLIYQGYSTTTYIFTLINDHVSGNIHVQGSDQTFGPDDVFTFLYDGTVNKFYMISKNQN